MQYAGSVGVVLCTRFFVAHCSLEQLCILNILRLSLMRLFTIKHTQYIKVASYMHAMIKILLNTRTSIELYVIKFTTDFYTFDFIFDYHFFYRFFKPSVQTHIHIINIKEKIVYRIMIKNLLVSFWNIKFIVVYICKFV